MQKQSKYENMAYVALWGLLFAAPLLSLYVRTTGDDGMAFNWQEAFMVWRRLAVFLLIFLVHNFFLAPLLIHRQKRWQYVLLTVCMIGLFTFYQCQQRPPMAHGFNHEPPPFEIMSPHLLNCVRIFPNIVRMAQYTLTTSPSIIAMFPLPSLVNTTSLPSSS